MNCDLEISLCSTIYLTDHSDIMLSCSIDNFDFFMIICISVTVTKEWTANSLYNELWFGNKFMQYYKFYWSLSYYVIRFNFQSFLFFLMIICWSVTVTKEWTANFLMMNCDLKLILCSTIYFSDHSSIMLSCSIYNLDFFLWSYADQWQWQKSELQVPVWWIVI